MECVIVVIRSPHSCGCSVTPADVFSGNAGGADVLASGCRLCSAVDHRTGNQTILLQLIDIDIAAAIGVGNGKLG